MKKQKQQNEVLEGEVKQEDQLVNQKTEREVWKDKYIRALADYQNLEKRTRDEHYQVRMFAGLAVIEKLLPVVDLLEKAADHLRDQGLELALKELYSFFHSVGVEKIDVLGKPFDPYNMDCIEIVPEGDENTVVSVVSDGYRMHGKIIRPAKVKVGKKVEEESINE
ncbi:MAG: Protein GrpE [Microgenomates group bacterium GW2011_GWC1_43_11]|uniref:Protein GrpE n=2 Tax=Candidatus Gottesmaniibacteriota TaxID=1752720 RepID=A0A0G1INM0_9BACT|nr:MAG: Protein GrpE [Microgenomates group bacterium GW2011_GWC1_43_11]KKT38596.1 MAG: Protein GrpE [Candidatus Gottesmanbacteria bacterium GW2011_GWB1_44_11c]KKT60725.1 MAG: Protein GrpE [Candidatus Gottesmanbacteria bacterium GW2011_GWA1_44_24b]HCM82261.1 nucleotide exchange factor GrpE [Patescibacteria group bacterium]